MGWRLFSEKVCGGGLGRRGIESMVNVSDAGSLADSLESRIIAET